MMTLLTCILFTAIITGVFTIGFYSGVRAIGKVLENRFPNEWKTIKEELKK